MDLWITGAAILLPAGSQRFLPWSLLAVAVMSLVRWAALKRWTVRTPLDWLVVGLCLLLPVTLWATALPEITRPQTYRLLLGVGLYYALVNWTVSPKRMRTVFLLVLLAAVGLAGFAFFSVEWRVRRFLPIPESVFQRFAILVQDVVHPNVMAGAMVLFVPLGLAALLFAWRGFSWRERSLAGLATILGIGVTVLTLSRGGLLALASALVFLVVLRWRKGWLGIVGLAIVVGVISWRMGFAQILDYLSTSGSVQGIEGRLEIWSRAIYMIQDFPFTGIGLGSFTRVADTLYPFFLSAPGTIAHAHNLFLQIAVDLGIPGLIFWLAAWFNIWAVSWQLYRKGKGTGNGLAAGLGAGLLASQLAMGVHGLVDAVVWGMVRSAPLVWGIWGLAVACWHVYGRPPSDAGVQALEPEIQ